MQQVETAHYTQVLIENEQIEATGG